MSGYLNDYTDEQLKELQGRINSVYKEANRMITSDAKAYFDRFEEQYSAKLKDVQSGVISKEVFANWCDVQMLAGKRYESLKENIATRLQDANGVAASYINDTTPSIYTLAQNYTNCQIESSGKTNISFSLVDDRAIRHLIMRNDLTLIPKSYPNIAKPNPKTYEWNEKLVTKTLAASILAGRNYNDLTKSLQQVTKSNYVTALRNARTILNGARSGGTQDALSAAVDMGLELEKEWNCSWVNTREWHAELDGVRVPVNEPFPNGIMHPADAGGTAAEVYNCKCFLAGAFKDSPKFSDKTKETYEAWYDEKVKESIEKDKPIRYGVYNNGVLRSVDDPMRDKIGSIKDSHPEEMERILKEAESLGVEVKMDGNSISYNPSPVSGKAGQLHVSPDDSLTAWLHEEDHMLKEANDGWKGFRNVLDIEIRSEREYSAYGIEVAYARKLGYSDVADKLIQNCKEEIERCGGVFDETRFKQ